MDQLPQFHELEKPLIVLSLATLLSLATSWVNILMDPIKDPHFQDRYENLTIYFRYRVRGLKLMHFRLTIFDDWMTFMSKVNDFWDPDIRRFDIKHSIFISSTSLGLHNLRKLKYQPFYKMWAWHPYDAATPLSFGLQEADYWGFNMRYCLFL